MKIVHYDAKHDSVIDCTDLGEISEKEKSSVRGVVHWINKQVNNRYSVFIFCESYEQVIEYDIDGDPYNTIKFT